MAYPHIVREVINDSVSSPSCAETKSSFPSINPGHLLRDIIASEKFSTVRLEHIYRTGEGSGIATEAPKIFSETEKLAVAPVRKNGFEIVLRDDFEEALERFGQVLRSSGPDNVVMISI